MTEKNEIAKIEEDVNVIVRNAEEFEILDKDDNDEAANILKMFDSKIAQIDAIMKPVIQKAFLAHRESTKQYNLLVDPLKKGASIIKGKMAAFFMAERKKAEAEAEAARQAAMTAARDAQERAMLEMVTPPAEAVARSVTKQMAKDTGYTEVTTYDFEVVDEALLPREYLMPDPRKIKATVARLKGNTKIAGVRVIEKTAMRRTAA